ncbi:radical S-adenosyl methionine domain-containing protein 1, mitochondrial-like isoform X1 [Pecten maximus]|uniref:radical S-adenosyl methionine domain-containing protein 1, mitochondrial-like isoform X1 n=2 Tax=Pecten maximus TaxID=6579 RepID=UPI001458539E|nr:radical S-adenosyl methionine domain-containing protein 1, mitochondrial-like isoform X1 [Pecten maximus]
MKMAVCQLLSKCFRQQNILSTKLPLSFRSNTQYSRDINTSDLSIEDQASLYVHWPYCSKRCTYCNFNKYINRNVDNERMTKCLTTETKTLIESSQVSRINSIFFGGGTPSLAEPRTIASVIEAVTKTTQLHAAAEVTLEVNPTLLETGKLRDFRSAGVNRVSIGVQAFKDTDLKVLGREHSSLDSIKCIEEAVSLYPGRVSVDVIFGRPGQTLDSWITEIHQVLSICDQHISLYQLTLERGTQLFKWVQSGLIELPEEDMMADMYLEAVEILEKHGFEQYEVSNFAKNGARSDHNTAYWTGQQYIGVGPGAHGRFVPRGLGQRTREARIQTLEPIPWMFEVERDGHATRRIVEQTDKDILKELVAVGLRTKEGVTHMSWNLRCPDHTLWSVFQGPTIASLINTQFIILDNRGLRTTKKGMAVLDAMLPDLIIAIENRFLIPSMTQR